MDQRALRQRCVCPIFCGSCKNDSRCRLGSFTMPPTPPILAIIGPTASGKSALAMAIAQHVSGEILSVDSMQVYRGMDIGTAKPTPAEQARVRHHLIDLVEANESFTVAKFVELADPVVADAAK